MLIEIPDPEVILGIVVAFFVGLFGLYFYFKIKPYIKFKPGFDPSQLERLEYYERQLIDMKIKLDAFDMEEQSTKLFDSEINQVEKLPKEGIKKNNYGVEKPNRQIHRAPNMGYQNATDYVLRLITDEPMTSRDIQITLGRSREHISRLMKKLFDDGYVKRSSDSKPYSYSITEKGKEKLKLVSTPTAA
jgi:predicted transcriptional regulator